MRVLAALVLVTGLVTPAFAVHAAPGRGELAAWVAQAGTWDGTGTDAQGGFTLQASVEALFGGKFVVIRARETRAAASREQLQIFTGGDGASAYVYDAGVTFRKLPGYVEPGVTKLAAGDASLRITWAGTSTGLKGTREEASASGALVPVATWTLTRTNAAAAPVRDDVENFEYMDGELKGDGIAAITPGHTESLHYTLKQTGVASLSDTLVYTRETRTFDNGRVDENLQLHFVKDGNPVRHLFTSRGEVVEYSGIFPDIAQMRFFTDVPGGKIVVHVVATCSGYKIVEELERPGQDTAWLGEFELKNVSPHALR